MPARLIKWFSQKWVLICEILILAFVGLIVFLEMRIFYPEFSFAKKQGLELEQIWVIKKDHSTGDAHRLFQGLAVDKFGNLYTAGPLPNQVTKVIRTVPPKSQSAYSDNEMLQPFVFPSGIAGSSDVQDGQVWFLDSGNGWIYQVDSSFIIHARLNTAQFGVYNPRGLARGENEDFFITDTGGARVLHITQKGELINEWGSYGRRREQFLLPLGVIYSEGSLFILDAESSRILHYTSTGKYLTSWVVEQGSNSLSMDSQGRIYVFGPESGGIKVYNTIGKEIGTIAKNQFLTEGEAINGLLALPNNELLLSSTNLLTIYKVKW